MTAALEPSHSVGADDVKGAREGLPRFLVAESAIMEFMAERDPSNWLGAICGIPRHLRSMYVHAYQVRRPDQGFGLCF